jgi:hypothetical protein
MAAGGTSFVSPQLNGLMALINQRWPSGNPAQPTRQGQADYTLYAMADHEYGTPSAENTSTSAPSVYTCESNADAISTYSRFTPMPSRWAGFRPHSTSPTTLPEARNTSRCRRL